MVNFKDLRVGQIYTVDKEIRNKWHTLYPNSYYKIKQVIEEYGTQYVEIEDINTGDNFHLYKEYDEVTSTLEDLQSIVNSWEQQYKNLVNELIEDGIDRDDRTGVGTLNLFNKQIIIDYKDNQNLLPILTLRKIKWENAFHELIFMLNGNTQTKELEKKGVNIWKGNTSKEFIKSRGLDHLLEEGQMGYIYGYNLRRFGNRYDQLKNLFKELEDNPLSRRLTLTTHDPSTVPFSVLPSCHGVFQQFFYNPKDNSLSLKQTQRSCDIVLGFPTNVIYYSLFLQLTAKCFNMNVGKLIMDLNDVHIYKNHIEKSKKMLERDLIEPPTFELNKDIKSLDDILDLSIDNINILNYNHHKGLLFEMAV